MNSDQPSEAFRHAHQLIGDGALLVTMLDGPLLMALHRDGRLVAGEDDVIDMLEENGVRTEAGVLTIQMLHVNRQRCRTQWSVVAIDAPATPND